MTDDLAARLLRAVLRRPGRPRVSLIGLSKNAGKTVTLNRLIRAAAAEGLVPGLLSTGRDGEAVDAVTELPKPRVWAPEGALVATALPALRAGAERLKDGGGEESLDSEGNGMGGSSTGVAGTDGLDVADDVRARVEMLAETGIPTPLGPVVIGRVVSPGTVLLVGPGSAARVGALLDAMEAAGAALCLVDGSFDRRAAAAPAVTGRAVLAAGAAYSASMAETVAQVRHLLEIFDLPPAPEGWLSRLRGTGAPAEGHPRGGRSGRSLPTAPVLLLPPDGPPIPVPVASALVDPAAVAEAAAAAPPGTVLSLSGALTDGLLTALLARRLGGLPILVDDPTHVLAGRSAWRRWRRQGGQVWVRRGIDVAAVTTNAYSPVGPAYDPAEFCARVAEVAGRSIADQVAEVAGRPAADRVAGRPVVDLVAGIAHNLDPDVPHPTDARHDAVPHPED